MFCFTYHLSDCSAVWVPLCFMKHPFPLPVPAVSNGSGALTGAQATPLSVLTGNKCAFLHLCMQNGLETFYFACLWKI